MQTTNYVCNDFGVWFLPNKFVCPLPNFPFASDQQTRTTLACVLLVNFEIRPEAFLSSNHHHQATSLIRCDEYINKGTREEEDEDDEYQDDGATCHTLAYIPL